MKPYTLLTSLLALLPTAALANTDIHLGGGTICQLRKPGLPNYTPGALDTLLDAWHGEFGHGGGKLNHGYGMRPTFQAVCCGGWCLVVEHTYDGNDYRWDRDAFDFAVDELRRSSPGRGWCTVKLPTVHGAWDRLTLSMVRETHEIVWSSEHQPWQKTPALALFGDTCHGAQGYNGPDW